MSNDELVFIPTVIGTMGFVHWRWRRR